MSNDESNGVIEVDIDVTGPSEPVIGCPHARPSPNMCPHCMGFAFRDPNEPPSPPPTITITYEPVEPKTAKR